MISIILPCRYRADLTNVCINSIINYTKDFELIVVWEGEDEGLAELFKVSKWFKLVHNTIPKGYSGALNAGMEVAEGDYFCFMNNDTVATPGWLEEMLKAYELEDVGLVSPTFWGAGTRQSVDWNSSEQFDYVYEPFDLMGVCFLIPRKVMERLDNPKGKWDERFFHGGEDHDLTIRISNLGLNLVIARKSFIYHYGGASTRIFVGNDMASIMAHHQNKIDQLIDKHGLDRELTYQKLRLK